MPGNTGRSSPNDGLVFQRIIAERRRGDKTYYKVQWKGQQLHTWELEEHLSTSQVAEFKRTLTPDAGQSTSTPTTSTSKSSLVGFARCLEPERILGMYEVNKKLMFKMKWKGSSSSDFVTVDEAKVKCPQLVIEYYEKRICWL